MLRVLRHARWGGRGGPVPPEQRHSCFSVSDSRFSLVFRFSCQHLVYLNTGLTYREWPRPGRRGLEFQRQGRNRTWATVTKPSLETCSKRVGPLPVPGAPLCATVRSWARPAHPCAGSMHSRLRATGGRWPMSERLGNSVKTLTPGRSPCSGVGPRTAVVALKPPEGTGRPPRGTGPTTPQELAGPHS